MHTLATLRGLARWLPCSGQLESLCVVPAKLALTLVLTLALALTLLAPPAQAGTLTKADVEALFPPPQLVGEKLAHLPVWPVFVRTGQGPVLQNHVFETVDLEPVAGYGGKPVNLLVVMDRDGAFVMTRLLSHTEPIFRSDEGTALLTRFGQQYQGLSVNHHIQVLGYKAQRVVTPTNATLHGIVAGTVTAMAIDRSIMEAAAQVAQAHADPALARGAANTPDSGPDDRYSRTGFNGLVAARLVQNWATENRALESQFSSTPGSGRDAEGLIRPQNAAIDLWLSFVGLPQAGRNLLAAPRWRQVRDLRTQGQPVLLVIDGSRYPLLAGTAAPAERRRGAALALRQGPREFALEELPWTQGLRVSGQHSGVSAGSVVRYYRVRAAADGTALDVQQAVQMRLSIWRHIGPLNTDVAAVALDREFLVPDAAAYSPQPEAPRWLEAWKQRADDLWVLGAGLGVLVLMLVAQRRTAATQPRLRGLRLAFQVFTLVFIGWYAQGQLTIVSLTSAVEALVAGRRLEFLLLDPMAVVLWAFTFITLAVWGRGTFCGWLCPFGALQELIARGAQAIGWAQRRVPLRLDAQLKRLKYAVLAVLVLSAVVSPAWAEWLVEVEPFKTSISMHFQRSWPYLAWAGLCLGLGAFVYRGYCRYICPLGAALAVLGKARQWRWIPRREECGAPCQSCRHKCEYQAIAPSGKVDYDECFQCLDCVQIHDDSKRCLPLVNQARGRVIPIRAVAAVGHAP
jgi:NosR/NirI family transcriptional regulator, nitrous oxide reductase regulator